MERIVVVYQINGDWGCSYEIVLSFRYESPEAWLLDFEKCLMGVVEKKKKDWDNEDHEFYFCGRLFDAHEFCNMFSNKVTYTLPSVYSIDEWFERNILETATVK